MQDELNYVGDVVYVEDITEEFESPATPYSAAHKTHRVIGKKRMKATVNIRINLKAIIADLGARAARSKGGKSQDGHIKVTVKKGGTELSREMKPLT